MSHPHSRKTFFAKLLGISAAIGLVPRLLAKPVSSAATAAASPAASGKALPISLRPEPRSVARTAGTE
ncbi:hypothetical protein OPIT5_22570 [Opitutaceae bacterium TAV5]|nr:hypothetical protein OPIT5_22570 [Opitutaceae bacterium TAV5]